ncbi:MAG: hypothetical protein IJY57_00885 [Clostridia bacterium]|nr:hypothetical protein [Clostridia bacterium]
MKKIFRFMFALVLMLCGTLFVGCAGGVPNFNEDVQVVLPENIDFEHFEPQENTTYYTSQGFSLMASVNGAFLEIDYFSLDGNKRVYDNLYFYSEDYIYAVSSDLKYLYAGLSDVNDLAYAEEEKQSGEEVQINFKKQGVYKVIFDVDTHKFDLEYKREITNPVYYTIKDCSFYTLRTSWVEMSVNPNNSNEFMLSNFVLQNEELIGFFSNLHISNYKITLDESCKNKYCSGEGILTWMSVGGTYNIYINKKTYKVRLELCDSSSATYGLVYYDGNDFFDLQPVDQSTPHLFKIRLDVDDEYTSVPKFYSSKYTDFDLTINSSAHLTKTERSAYFKTIGTYDITVDLLNFEISVELLAE